MPRPGRFGRRWRERKCQALERELRQLHEDRTCPWERHPTVRFQVGRFTEWLKIDPAVVLHLGRHREEFLAEPGWDPYICPADHWRTDALWLRCSLNAQPYTGLEYRWRHADSGRYVYLSETLFPQEWGRDGKPLRMSGWFENISARKRAEIEFLLWCLDASGKRGREARFEVIRRVRGERRASSTRLPLLGPPPPRRRPDR
jgi:PAS domain-containing protein